MATQQQTCDFAFHGAKAAAMTHAALVYTIKDCLEAALIHDEMDRANIPNNSGRYWDEYFTYSKELHRRTMKGGGT